MQHVSTPARQRPGFSRWRQAQHSIEGKNPEFYLNLYISISLYSMKTSLFQTLYIQAVIVSFWFVKVF